MRQSSLGTVQYAGARERYSAAKNWFDYKRYVARSRGQDEPTLDDMPSWVQVQLRQTPETIRLIRERKLNKERTTCHLCGQGLVASQSAIVQAKKAGRTPYCGACCRIVKGAASKMAAKKRRGRV